MEDIERKLITALIEAERNWQSAEHIIRVIMPVVKDQKILLRALETLYKGSVLTISAILKHEYLYKRISLYKNDTNKNLEIFFIKCAPKYGLSNEEQDALKQLVILGKKHKESGFEFSRAGKVVILDDDLKTNELRSDMINIFIISLRKLIINAKSRFIRQQNHHEHIV